MGLRLWELGAQNQDGHEAVLLQFLQSISAIHKAKFQESKNWKTVAKHAWKAWGLQFDRASADHQLFAQASSHVHQKTCVYKQFGRPVAKA